MKKKATVHYLIVRDNGDQRLACSIRLTPALFTWDLDRRKVTCDRCTKTKAYDEAGKRKRR